MSTKRGYGNVIGRCQYKAKGYYTKAICGHEQFHINKEDMNYYNTHRCSGCAVQAFIDTMNTDNLAQALYSY